VLGSRGLGELYKRQGLMGKLKDKWHSADKWSENTLT